MVRAKMRCVKVSQTSSAYGAPSSPITHHEIVELHALTGPGNEQWSKYTPAGKVEMSITKEGAIGQFKVGQDYFVDFTPAPMPAAEEK